MLYGGENQPPTIKMKSINIYMLSISLKLCVIVRLWTKFKRKQNTDNVL